MICLTVSIVCAGSDLTVLKNTIESAKNHQIGSQIVVVDNGLQDEVKELVEPLGCHYLRPRENIGFGSAHNLAIQKYAHDCNYFLILNPDVEIHPGCIESLVELMEKHPEIVLSTPKVLNPDGTLQRVHKRLPSLKILFGRRFFPRIFNYLCPDDYSLYELQDRDLDRPHYIPNVSGCFMFFRSRVLLKVKGFDERYFMYQEDVDISRRINREGPIVYWPGAKITHIWARGSHKSLKLTWFNIVSVLRYFMKWGFDHRSEVRFFDRTEAS